MNSFVSICSTRVVYGEIVAGTEITGGGGGCGGGGGGGGGGGEEESKYKANFIFIFYD